MNYVIIQLKLHAIVFVDSFELDNQLLDEQRVSDLVFG